MTSTNFTDKQPVIVADWLNDANDHVYDEQATAHTASHVSFV